MIIDQVTIAAAGAIPPLVELLRFGSDWGKENAAGALGNLALNDQNQVTIRNVGAVSALENLVESGTATQKEIAREVLGVLVE